MSRIGKKQIIIPAGITFTFDKDTRLATVKSSKAELVHLVNPYVTPNLEGNVLTFSVKNPENKKEKALWGTTRSIIANLIEGLTIGYKKQLELNGVGYKMELGTKLTLYVGFSHPVIIEIPKSINLTLNKNVLLGESIDKQKLGDFFAYIHDIKPCDVYKHKGFKFPDRFYPKKVGKKSK